MSILSVVDEQGNEIPIPSIKGKSAYEYAKDGGYTGTEAEFAQKMAKEFAIKSDTISASTDSSGYIPMASKILPSWTVVAVQYHGSHYGVHFKHNNNQWYARVFDLASGEVIKGTVVSITAYYFE